MGNKQGPVWKENSILLILGAFLIALPTSWFLFFEIIQPALASLSPVFEYDPDGYIGRAPDSLAQMALFATILFGLFVYYNIDPTKSGVVEREDKAVTAS